MQTYDVVMVVRPDTDEKQNEVKLKDLLSKSGFSVGDFSSWGKRKLAYPIKKQTEGFYFAAVISADTKSDSPRDLLSQFKLDESLLRSLIVKKELERVRKPGKVVKLEEVKQFMSVRSLNKVMLIGNLT